MTTISKDQRCLTMFLLFALFLFMTSVSSSSEDKEINKNVEIHYKDSGGCFGGVVADITINHSGEVISNKSEASLIIQLSKKEHEEILSHVDLLRTEEIKIKKSNKIVGLPTKKLWIKTEEGNNKLFSITDCFEVIEPENVRAHVCALLTLLKSIAERIE